MQEAGAAAGRCRTEANREARLARIPAIEAERERKIADLAGRYAVEIRLSPIAAVRAHVPGRRIRWEVRRRQETRALSFVYDLVGGGTPPRRLRRLPGRRDRALVLQRTPRPLPGLPADVPGLRQEPVPRLRRRRPPTPRVAAGPHPLTDVRQRRTSMP